MPPEAQNQNPNPNQPVTPPAPDQAPELAQPPVQPAAAPEVIAPESPTELLQPEAQPPAVLPQAPMPEAQPPAPEAKPATPQPEFTPPVQQSVPPAALSMQVASPPPQDPNVLGIFGIILAFFFWPAGLVCSIVALKKHSNKALGIVGLVLNLLALLAFIVLIVGSIVVSHTAIQDKAKDTKYTADIHTIQSQLEGVFATDGAYPSLEELNSATWRDAHMKSLSPETLSPNSSQTQLVSKTPTSDAYAYTPAPSGCGDNLTNPCKSYDLAYRTTAGLAYSVHSVD